MLGKPSDAEINACHEPEARNLNKRAWTTLLVKIGAHNSHIGMRGASLGELN